MKRDVLLVIISLFVIILAVFLLWLAFSRGESVSIVSNCTVIMENPGNKKINIVFFLDNVLETEIHKQIEYFLNSPPYNNHKEKFNFYFAGKTDCGLTNEALFCYSKDLVKKSTVCPNDYVIVLSEEPQKIRSSSYMNVISINTNHPKTVFLHEFGHAFANLADEYIPSVIPYGSKNCASNCDLLSNFGCFEGCSKTNYFRSSEESVMKTLKTNDYKELNIDLINEQLENYE